MSKKVRLTRVTIVEYELNPEYYPDNITYEQMAAIDVEAGDRELLFDDAISDEVAWEIIED